MTHTQEHCHDCNTPITATNSAALYARISSDQEGTELGVERQEEDAIDILHDHGLHVAERHWFRENDISASTKSFKPRPKYEQMINAARAGDVIAIGAYSNSRLTRRPREAEDILDLVEKHRVKIMTTASGDVDLSTPDGRAFVRGQVARDAHESEVIGQRVRRMHLQAARAGRSVVGGHAFGWKADRIHLEPAEAKLIRKAAKDVIAGVPLSKIAEQWNAKKITTPRGNRWTYKAVRQSLANPRMAGWRVYQNKIAQDRAGNQVKGDHAPILTEEVHDQLLTAMRRPSNGRATRKGSHRYLLSGLTRCGICGRTMYGARKTYTVKDGSIKTTHHYSCHQHGHINNVSGKNLDKQILDAVQAALEERDSRVDKPKRPDFDGHDRIAELNTEIRDIMGRFENRTVRNTAETITVLDMLTAERDELITQRREHDQAAVADRQREIDLSTGALAAAKGDIDLQRKVVASMIEGIVVQKATRPGDRRFDLSRLRIAWV